MSLSRADLLTYLQSQFSAYAAESGQVTTDTAAGYEPAIDYALRKTGTAQADLAAGTIPTGSEDIGFKLAAYFALERFLDLLAVGAVDTRVGDIDQKRSQMVAAIQKSLDRLEKDPEVAGYLSAQWGFGSLGMDYIEPGGAA